MPAQLRAPSSPIPANFQRAIDAAARLVAENGIKGTSLRDVGLEAGVNFGNLATYFGGKDKIIAECFWQLAESNLQRTRQRFAEAVSLGLSPYYAASILWELCDDDASRHRTETLAIMELVLSADGNPLFSEVMAAWLRERCELFRQWGHTFDLPEVASDTLSLLVLTESCFHLSCGDSLHYRLVARGSMAEIVGIFLKIGSSAVDSLPDLAEAFFAQSREAANDETEAEAAKGTRAQIIEAAADIVAEQGLDSVSSRLAAQKAGISLGLISYYFPSVTDLALAGLNRLLGRSIEEIENPETRSPVIERMLSERRRPVTLPRASLLAYRSMLQLALAAGRMPSQASAGQRLRRGMGAVAMRAIDFADTRRNSRTLASSFALITAALFTILPALPAEDYAIDLPALLQFLTFDMLGFPDIPEA